MFNSKHWSLLCFPFLLSSLFVIYCLSQSLYYNTISNTIISSLFHRHSAFHEAKDLSHSTATELLSTISRSSESVMNSTSIDKKEENGTLSSKNDSLNLHETISLKPSLINDPTFRRTFSRKWKSHRIPKRCKWRVFPKDKEISPTSVTPPKNKPVLAMAITTDAKRISRPLQNTLAMMNLYQQQYSFRGVVFTTSSRVIDACKKYNLTVITDMQRNEYGLPIVSYMFQRMVVSVDASYYGYMNSDILFPPDVFTILSVTYGKMKAGIVSKNVGLIGTVHDTPFPFESKDFSSVKKLDHVFKIGERGRSRNTFCIDIFIYPSTFQFSHIPPVVVGRIYVDSVLFQVPEYDDGYNILISQYCTFIHQGSDNYKTHGFGKQSKRDKYYNEKFLFTPVSITPYSRFILHNDNHLWECARSYKH